MRAMLLTLGLVLGMASMASADEPQALGFTVTDIEGKEVKLSDYKGKVILVVNVASRCGLTPQYEGLEAMYDKYKDQGFVVLAFPCNQFGGQEPGTAAEIKEFCTGRYDVSFPLFAKIDVNGDGASDLYKYLTGLNTEPKAEGPITWNFEKFLIDREGNVVNRFQPRTAPSDAALVSAVEAALAK